MRALITGASGFVGRTLAAHLRAEGDVVLEIDRLNDSLDITDRDATLRHIASAVPEVVYHLAAQSHVPTSWTDPIGTMRTNAEGTQNVLDASFEAGVARVLVVSSAEVYGSVSAEMLPIDEQAPLRPVTPYAASKVAADAIALQSHLGRGQDVVRLRAFNHIGPGQRSDFVCAGLAHRIAVAERDGSTGITVGSLETRRDFTDVRDVVRAYRLIAEHGDAGEVYNVCSGIDRSIGEIAEMFLELARGDFTLIQSGDLTRKVDTPIVRGDNSKLRNSTGWEPTFTLATSLSDILDDARERLHANTP